MRRSDIGRVLLTSAVMAMASLLPVGRSRAETSQIVFNRANPHEFEIVRSVLAKEIEEAEAEGKKPGGLFGGVHVAWAKVSPSESPYLFVIITSFSYCGSKNCEVWGFAPTGSGWRTVFNGDTGNDLDLLDSLHVGHRDIRSVLLPPGGSESDDLDDSIFNENYFWNGTRYELQKATK